MKTCDHGIPMDHHCALCMHEGKGARPLADLGAASLESPAAKEAESLRQQLAESERQRRELVKLMQLLRSALREVLWIATVWNDHNHSAETIRRKASNIARDLGVNRGDDSADKLLDKIDAAVAGQDIGDGHVR